MNTEPAPGRARGAARRRFSEGAARVGAVAAFAGFMLVSVALAGVEPEPPDAYELVVPASLQRLPIQHRSVFEPHREIIRAHAVGQGHGRFAPGPPLSIAGSHYLMLDVAADNPTPAARLVAVRAFPRDPLEAQRLFRDRDQREGGSLPWVMAQQCDALASAIRERNEQETARLAGTILHLAVDACLPFNTSMQRLGPAAGQFVLPADPRSEWLKDCAHARGRAQDSLARRHRSVLAAGLSESPTVCCPVEDVAQDVFRAMMRSSATLDGLLEADRKLVQRWDLRDGLAFVDVADAFLGELDRDALPAMQGQLDAAACLAAGVLARAAAEGLGETPPSAAVSSSASAANAKPGAGAGRPSGAGGPARPGEVAPARGDAKSPAATGGPVKSGTAVALFVGSRNSTKYHRPDCRHAQNIKDDNRMTFSSGAEARAAGREPCGTCDPKD